MTGLVEKAVGEPIVVLMDWREGYLAEHETVSGDAGWSVQPCDPASNPIFVVEQHFDFWRSWAEFEGGQRGCFYLVSARIHTSRGREISRSLVMRVSSGIVPN